LKEILGKVLLLFTIRTSKEGGNLEITYEKYSEILKCVAGLGAVDLIDVEGYISDKKSVENLIDEIHRLDTFVIGSSHNFLCADIENFEKKIKYLDELGADILKVAVMPQDRADVAEILSLTFSAKKYTKKPIVTMAMGRLGVISRIAGETFGSAITFGCVKEASAPGQIDAKLLSDILDIL